MFVIENCIIRIKKIASYLFIKSIRILFKGVKASPSLLHAINYTVAYYYYYYYDD